MIYNQFMRYVLVFEAVVLNFGTGLLCLVAPAMFVAQFATETLPAVPLELIRWYGVLLWVLTFFVLRILPANDNRLLSPAVEALLFGDLVHLVAIFLFYQARPEWNFSFVIMLFFTLTLAVLRSVWVYRYYRNLL
ncbi:MAG: hypothetical protein Fur0016_12660 [Anaerolineales bacterium]